LCVYFVRDSDNVGKQLAEFHAMLILVQRRENADLQNSGFIYDHGGGMGRDSLPPTPTAEVFVIVNLHLSSLSIPIQQPQGCAIKDRFLTGETTFGQGDLRGERHIHLVGPASGLESDRMLFILAVSESNGVLNNALETPQICTRSPPEDDSDPCFGPLVFIKSNQLSEALVLLRRDFDICLACSCS
jgi:hypothetical protein